MMPGDVHLLRDDALGNTSYLIVVGGGSAVAVDPPRDVDEHLALARRLSVRIVAVLETHLHADFVTGSRELQDATGAVVYAARDCALTWPHTPVADGDRFRIGDGDFTVLATPGHTPEHVTYRMDLHGARAVFTGGSLIAGGAARTDLTGAERTEELARAQYVSLNRIARLPGDTAVYPTHGGGSFCSTGRARSAATTVDEQRATNPLLAIRDEREFVKELLAGFGSFPPYFLHLRDVNRRGPALLASLPEPQPMSARDALGAVASGAWLIDGRPVERWAARHVPGSVSIAVRPAFASWLGWVVPFGRPIVLLADDERRDQALRLARRIGYDEILGWIGGGIDEVVASGIDTASVPFVDPADARERIARGAVLLDVRQRSEWQRGHAADAEHLELGDIVAGRAPAAEEVVTYCAHGERAATAASLLERRGIAATPMRGGVDEWRAAGLAVTA